VNIIEQIDRLADTLESHSFITLHEVKSKSGLTESELNDLEQKYDVKLSQSVRDLYKQVNGFLLHWTMRPDLLGITQVSQANSKAVYELNPKKANLEYPDAIIRFLPLEEILNLDWSSQFFPDDLDQYDYRGKMLKQPQIRGQLRPFDECGLFCVAAFCDTSFERVILITDHLTNWNDSIEITLPEYLDFIFSSAGIIEARMDIFLRGYPVNKNRILFEQK
jgi:hypothetical protein